MESTKIQRLLRNIHKIFKKVGRQSKVVFSNDQWVATRASKRIQETRQPEKVTWIGRESTFGRCPRCDSPSPGSRPAIMYEGEVVSCNNPFHYS